MGPKLLEYYRRELDFLRESGREFAAAHPREARSLGMGGDKRDPHVERLLQGVAFLTARTRAKIENELPEVTDALLGVLYPHYAQPIPSMSVIRIGLDPAQSATLRNGPMLAAGSALRTRRGGPDPACEFRTSYPVTLWPLQAETPTQITQVQPIDAARGARAVLSVPLRCLGAARLGDLGPGFDSLRFFLGGEGRAPFALRDRLLNEVVRIEVRSSPDRPGGPALTHEIRDPGRNLRSVGFGRDEGVLPFPGEGFLGYRNLREYFAFPEKFLFVELRGLAKLRGWGQATGAEIRFYLRRPLDADVRLGEATFQLHCTPIINLFEQDCQPIRRDETRVEYPVEPGDAGQPDLEIFAIDRVSSESEVYRPFYDHRGIRSESGPATYWQARRSPTVGGSNKRTRVSLAFIDSEFRPRAPAARAVSVRARCTNLDLPSRLTSAELESNWLAPTGAIRRLVPMSQAWPPPMGVDAQWRLIALLALNHLPIGDPAGDPDGAGAEALRQILRLHAPSDDEATREQIRGIVRVATSPDTAYVRGRGVVGGVRTTIEFDAGRYGYGHLLLAEVLEQFLGHYVSINAFSRLVATSEGGEREWPPRAGDKLLI